MNGHGMVPISSVLNLPTNLEKWMVLLDLGASLTLIGNKTLVNIAEIQKQKIHEEFRMEDNLMQQKQLNSN